MSTLSKIEFAGRTFYYDSRGHDHITTGTIEKGDLLLMDAGDTLRCYPAFWDDIGRPISEFPLGILRPTKAAQVASNKSTLERFVDFLDTRYPNSPSPLVGCLICGAVGVLIFVLIVLLFSL